ncbi:putative cation diffusion facilitator [Scheffersomyces coipomensis]|uniref:putative cation diffusion facilitator n=1 Tax=Scheffersomyces coipomensis TaxID=1788519 RepID=UPI00315D48C1
MTDNNESQPLIDADPLSHSSSGKSYNSVESFHGSKSTSALNKVAFSSNYLNNNFNSGFRNDSAMVSQEDFLRSNSIMELHRSATVSQVQKPLFHRLIAHQFSVSNASSPHEFQGVARSASFAIPNDQASVYSVSDQDQRRMSIINILRPTRLIGSYKAICNWYDYLIDDKTINSSKSSAIREYYREQNEIIERLQEIDNFLDAGKVHYNMLTNYGTDSRILTTHVEDDEDETLDDQTPSNHHNKSGSSSTPATSPRGNGRTPDDLESQLSKSKYSRFYIVPGNIDHDGSKFLGYDEEADAAEAYTAIMVNFFLNFLLLCGKVVVTLLTNSISVVASLVDSILDFLSTFIIFIANKLSTSKDWRVLNAFPVGRSRLEPLGILVFSIIIIISFAQVGQEAFKKLAFSAPEDRIAAQMGLDSIAIMTVTIISKIGCWIWCSKSKSSSVQALAQDAETDIVFNLVSLLMPTVGFYLDIWWLDPLGAVLLSFYVIFGWSKTAFEHINNLTGAAADPLDYKIILYLAYRFAEPIEHITALKVYHVGDNLNVEIDIVFAKEKYELSFKDCHDIAEALQYSIETLPMVERAFVHIDYMEGNFKGHLK